jgi:hypothetical protein
MIDGKVEPKMPARPAQPKIDFLFPVGQDDLSQHGDGNDAAGNALGGRKREV